MASITCLPLEIHLEILKYLPSLVDQWCLKRVSKIFYNNHDVAQPSDYFRLENINERRQFHRELISCALIKVCHRLCLQCSAFLPCEKFAMRDWSVRGARVYPSFQSWCIDCSLRHGRYASIAGHQPVCLPWLLQDMVMADCGPDFLPCPGDHSHKFFEYRRFAFNGLLIHDPPKAPVVQLAGICDLCGSVLRSDSCPRCRADCSRLFFFEVHNESTPTGGIQAA